MNDLAVLTNAIPEEEAPEPRDAWIFPTSLAQRRLWFLDRANPTDPLYHVPNAFHVRGRLDHALLNRAFSDVIDRHEILRTTFRLVHGEPMQLVSAISDFHLALVDLRSLAGSGRDAEISRILRDQSELPFDLRNGPLIRAALLDLDPAEQILVICLHHSITDCYSQELLMAEVTSAYSAMVKGDAPSFPELPIQYADFAAWQRDTLQGEILEKELAFWRAALAGLAPVEFPHLPPDAHARAPEAGAFRFELPEPLCASLRAMGQREGVTPFMSLLTGWKIFLARYTGQTDIGVSSPLSGRTRPETEGLIGTFLNTLLLRTSLAGNPTVRETLHRVRASALDAFAHQDLPFETMADDLRPEPAPGKNPLLRAMFVLMTGEEKTWQTPDALLEPLILPEPAPRFDLMLRLRDTGRTVTGVLVYDQALFTPAIIRHIAAQYETLLSAMPAHPDIGIDSFHLVPPDEHEAPPREHREGGEEKGLVDGRAQSPGRHAQPEREAAGSPAASSHPQSLEVHPQTNHNTPPPPAWEDSAPATEPSEEITTPPLENPATWMEATLVEIWQDILNRRPIAVTEDFFDLGGNSLLAIRMLVEAEKRTGIHIAPRLVFEYPTVRRLAVEARHPEARTHSPIVAVQTGGSLSPFFFLHGDFVEGGLYCVNMARHLGPERPFYAIDPHGVHDIPPHSIEDMAADRIELIRKVHPKGPYALGGFCNGGLVAFEMARQLEAAGETVSSLVLISVDGSNAEFSWLERLIGLLPGSPDRKFRSFLEWRERILFARAAAKRQFAALATPVPLSRQPRRFARKAFRILRKLFGLLIPRRTAASPGVDITQPKAAGIDIGLIYHQACKAYVPRPYHGPAHVLWPSEMALRDSAAGWSSIMPQIKLLEVPGGHFSSLQGENLLVVSESLRACLLADKA